MAIPASVTLYANWVHGALASSTYTAAAPERPSEHAYTFQSASLTTEAGAPWDGQTLATLPFWYARIYTTVSAATTPTTQGRFLVELNAQEPGGAHIIMLRHAANEWDGHIWFQQSGGNLHVNMGWNGDSSSAQVNLGAYPTVPYAIEVIYDGTNATANQRLRARWWAIGGTPGSFTNATSASGGPAALAEFTELRIGDEELAGLKFGRIIFSNNLAEDLSLVSEADDPPTVVDNPYPGPAGRSKRTKYVVEVDGQLHRVSSPVEAEALIRATVRTARKQAKAKPVSVPKIEIQVPAEPQEPPDWVVSIPKRVAERVARMVDDEEDDILMLAWH